MSKKPKNTQVEVLPAVKKKRSAASSKDVVTYDPLVAYLREIRAISKLSKEEEHSLAIDLVENKNVKSAYKLVSANLWLVVKIAREYERMAKNILDIIQEGNMGLMEAVKNYDPHRGVRLPSYASWWIKAYIVKYILANWRLVKIGTTQAQKKLFFNLNKEKERLEREGFKVTPKLIAQNLDVKESEVIEMQQRLGSPDLSVDTPINEGNDTWHSILPSSEPDSEEVVYEKQFKVQMGKAILEFKDTLKENQLVVFEKRLLEEKKVTLQEVADILKISAERVRQVENNLKAKFKEFMQKNYGSIVDDALE